MSQILEQPSFLILIQPIGPHLLALLDMLLQVNSFDFYTEDKMIL